MLLRRLRYSSRVIYIYVVSLFVVVRKPNMTQALWLIPNKASNNNKLGNIWPGQQKWTKLAQNTLNHKMLNIKGFVCSSYALYVSCKMLLIKCFINGSCFILIAWSNHYLWYNKVENVVKLYLQTWSIFAGPVTRPEPNVPA